MKKITLFSFIYLFFIASLFAQEPTSYKGIKIFKQNQFRGIVSSEQIFNQEFQLNSQNQFISVKNEANLTGFTTEKFQQYYQGVKVEFGEISLHRKQGNLHSMSYNVAPLENVNVSPGLSSENAFNRAILHVGASRYLWEDSAQMALVKDYARPMGELVVFSNPNNTSFQAVIAYKFDIYAIAPLYRADVYVDAQTGQILLENNTIHIADVPATGESLYNGIVSFTADDALGNFRLQQTLSGGGVNTFDLNNGTNYAAATDITSDTNVFSVETATGVQAHWGAENTYNYFSQKHGRDSYDNQGTPLNSYVSYGFNYVNAFWDGSRMTYGDGDGVNYGPLVSLDIVGHEIAHGVTQHSANLLYQKESGALNESFSDIFGEAIEFFGSGTNDWLMGDHIGAGGSNGALRSFSNPNQFGDPDTYGGVFWINPDCSPSPGNDYCGVHTNSGVQNYWFYLLSVGGSGTNDIGNDFTVNAIGMEKAAAVAYRNLSVYLNSTSTFEEARIGAIQSAIDLYGENSQEEIEVTNAWHAVGVGNKFLTPNSIKNLVLVDANSNEDILELKDGVEINLLDLSTNLLNIRADVTSLVESVSFELVGPLIQNNIDNAEQYSLFGGSSSGEFLVGDYTLTVTPYSEDDAGGDIGNGITMNFSIISVDEVPPVLTCSGDIFVQVGENECETIVTIEQPLATDNSGNVISITGTRNDGKELAAPFSLGNTYIEWVAVDEADNESIHCIQTINVQESISQTLVCPEDISVLASGVNGAIVSYELPNVSNSNCVDISEITTKNYIVNGRFETADLSGWILDISGSGSVIINDGSYDPPGTNLALEPISGNYDVIFAQTGPTKQLISKPFTVPTNVMEADISWKDRIRNTASVFSDPSQEFRVELLDENMNVISEIFSTNPGDPNIQIGPNPRQFELTEVLQEYAGKQVCVKFVEEDNLNHFNVNLDDISLNITGNNSAQPEHQITQTAGLSSGSLFPIGTTTNTFEVQNAQGVSTCSFDVVVNFNFENAFVTTWKTDNPGVSDDNQITIPTHSEETYNFSVNWGDGTSDSGVTGDITHTYAVPGTYEVAIIGEFPRISFNPFTVGDQTKILLVNQWGNASWTSFDLAFYGCSNLDIVATDVPDLSRVNSLAGAFWDCNSLRGNNFFNEWDISNVTDLTAMFFLANSFNQPLDKWDLRNVTQMSNMFFQATQFNQPLDKWNVENVENMHSMFKLATSFNQNLEKWNIEKVSSMIDFLDSVTLSEENYDAILNSWSNQQIQSSLVFDAGNSQYCSGESGRQKLIDDFGWTITDGGKASDCEEPNDFALRINAGGVSTTYNGETFVDDIYFNTGNTLDRPQTGLPEPYRSFRFSRSQQMSYNIPVPDGEYTVNLYFAELWFGATGGGSGGVGSRVFDVNIENILAEDNLDVFAEVGADAMLMKAYTVTVTDGMLNIDFDSRAEVGGERHPIVNAIEILGKQQEPQRPFITTWKTDNPGISNDNQITIPTFPGETYNYTVDWGDGTSDSGVTGDIVHTYATAGTYKVSISGDFPRIYFNNPSGIDSFSDASKLMLVEQWGDLTWSTMNSAFNGCKNLDVNALDSPNLKEVSDLSYMFGRCASLIGNSAFGDWDISGITNMSNLFAGASSFNNEGVITWNTSNVTNMSNTFNGSGVFNQNIGSWDTSKVERMEAMFLNASLFNQDIGGWDVSQVTDMYLMFEETANFNQDISNWDVSKVKNMGYMFHNSSLSQENYDALLLGWSSLPTLQNGVIFDASSKYCSGESGRQKLIDDFGWTITDGGKASDCEEPNDFALRINAGGVSTTYNGETFVDDIYFNTGNTLDRPQTGLPEPYQSFRFSRSQQMSYNIPVPDGEYTVNLYFAELWFGATGGGSGGVGSRVFDVNIENILAEDNLDVFAEVGADAMLMKAYTVTVTDGMLNIDFDSRAEVGGERHPIVNAIEILGKQQEPQRPFITTWKTDNPGISNDNQITIPTFPGETYNYTVDWGDGTSDNNVTGDITHTYVNPGEYQVSISGDFPRLKPGGTFGETDKEKLIFVNQWGDIEWQTFNSQFAGCTNLDVLATDVPNLSKVISFSAAFSNCASLVGNDSFNDWIMTNAQDISYMFFRASSFNQNIDAWDLQNVTEMNDMFHGAESFNKDIGSWKFPKVTSLNSMFEWATNFNGDISGWDVSGIVYMGDLFYHAYAFNQDLSNWDVGNVESMENTFFETRSFNQNISNWNVSSVLTMRNLFFNSGLSTENYDNILIGWSTQQLQNGVIFDGGDSQYCLAEEARQKLIDDFGWIITDGGKASDCIDINPFITTWNTVNPGTSEDNQITIPTFPGETYNYTVDWGDGTSDNNVTGDITHTYPTSGTYEVSISGDFPRIYFSSRIGQNINDSRKIINVNQWGSQIWTSMENAFSGCDFMDVKAIDVPDLSEVNNMSGMFNGCESLKGNEFFNDWNLSSVTNMAQMFAGCTSFNQEIGAWNVANVINMHNMFGAAISFNQNIDNWNVGNVVNMQGMFIGAESFNQNINSWDVSSVTNMDRMFLNATNFNGDISDWNISNVAEISSMFRNCVNFNQDISNWNISGTINISGMFDGASSFNQDIGSWDVSHVNFMIALFRGCTNFDQDISGWDVSNVKSMLVMFSGATSFNQDIGNWDVGNVIGMFDMFLDAGFSQDNYDKLLMGWSSLPSLQNDVLFNAGNSQYCDGEQARQKIINDYGWIITDGGKAADCEEPNDFALRINTGGVSASYNGEAFEADTYFNTGNTLDRPQTGLPEPYQSFRYSPSQQMSYNIPVPDGEYTVNLYFAELWFGATGGGSGGVGSRVFDVNIEGVLAEDNLDIFAEVGADAMLMKAHTVTVTGGVLNIDFDSSNAVGGERHPVINAIEVLSINNQIHNNKFFAAKGVGADIIGLNNVEMQLFPNPAQEHTTVSFSSAITIDAITIFDIHGRLIQTISGNNVSKTNGNVVNVDTFSPGMYIIRAKDTAGNTYQKQLVVR